MRAASIALASSSIVRPSRRPASCSLSFSRVGRGAAAEDRRHHLAVGVDGAVRAALGGHAEQVGVERGIAAGRDRAGEHQPALPVRAQAAIEPRAQQRDRVLRHLRPGSREHGVAVRGAVEDRDVGARLAGHEDELTADAGIEQRVLDHPSEVAGREAAGERLVTELLEHARDVDALAADVPADRGDAVRVAFDQPIDLDRLVNRRVEGDGDDHSAPPVAAGGRILGPPHAPLPAAGASGCSILARDGEGIDALRARIEQRARGGGQRRAGRRDVVDQQHSGGRISRSGGERVRDVGGAPLRAERGLGRGRTRATQ